MNSEKGSWCHERHEIFPSADDNAVATSASDNFPTHAFESDNAEKSGTEFCGDESILDDTTNAADNNSFSYTLDDIAQPVGNLEFLGNTDSRDSTDLLGFPELGNFEDVDRMFRSCDSTFGDGASKEDEPAGLPMENIKEEIVAKEEITEQNKEFNRQQHYTGERNDQEVKNDGFDYAKNHHNGVIRQPCEPNCSQTPPPFLNQHQEEDSEPSSCRHLQSSLSSAGSDKIHLSNGDPIISDTGTGMTELSPPSPIDFSLAFNHLQTKESPHDKLATSHAEIGSSNTRESLITSSVGDDTSLEAASLVQLQLVLEKLDIRMKLCIRDSLYRLALSAEQRHHHANLNCHVGDDNEANASLLPEGASSFINFEANTNPIDRSVAQLLFHRPSEPSTPLPRRKPSL